MIATARPNLRSVFGARGGVTDHQQFFSFGMRVGRENTRQKHTEIIFWVQHGDILRPHKNSRNSRGQAQNQCKATQSIFLEGVDFLDGYAPTLSRRPSESAASTL